MLNVKKLLTKILHAVMPSGGSKGQVLAKNSGTNYDAGWASLNNLVLLWTNPSGAGSKTATRGEGNITLSSSADGYNGYLCEFRCVYNDGTKTYDYYFPYSGTSTRTWTFNTSGNPFIGYTRYWYLNSNTQMWFSNCVRVLSNASPVSGQDTGCLVPLRIWGIKNLGGGGYFIVSYLLSHLVERWWEYVEREETAHAYTAKIKRGSGTKGAYGQTTYSKSGITLGIYCSIHRPFVLEFYRKRKGILWNTMERCKYWRCLRNKQRLNLVYANGNYTCSKRRHNCGQWTFKFLLFSSHKVCLSNLGLTTPVRGWSCA